MTSIEEQEIIKRIVNGEKQLYSKLISKYQQRIFAAMFSWVRDYDDAMDLTQDVFIHAFRALPGFRGEAAFYTWLMKIAINRKNSFFKKKSVSKGAVSIDAVMYSDKPFIQLEDERQDVERDAVKEDLKEKTYEEMLNMPEKYREFIVLRDIKEFTYEEIADMTGLKMAAVKTRIHRARKMLIKRLQKRGLL